MSTETNREYLNPHQIPHGTEVPLDLIRHFLPSGGLLSNLGCGTMQRVCTLQKYYGVLGIDINVRAIDYARNTFDAVAVTGDATMYWQPNLFDMQVALIENMDGVILEGLLSNLTGSPETYTSANTQIRRVLRTADMNIRPGGFLFIADVQTANESNPVLDAYIARHPLHTGYYGKWQERYRVNEDAGFAPGVFAVARSSLDSAEKNRLDWGANPDELGLWIHDPTKFERTARHVRVEALISYSRRLGFRAVEFQQTVWFSRTGLPLSGFILVLTKSNDRYKYHPRYRGKTREQRRENSDSMADILADPLDYDQHIRKALIRNTPRSMQGGLTEVLDSNGL